jgi:hypothetical protein
VDGPLAFTCTSKKISCTCLIVLHYLTTCWYHRGIARAAYEGYKTGSWAKMQLHAARHDWHVYCLHEHSRNGCHPGPLSLGPAIPPPPGPAPPGPPPPGPPALPLTTPTTPTTPASSRTPSRVSQAVNAGFFKSARGLALLDSFIAAAAAASSTASSTARQGEYARLSSRSQHTDTN